jgi:adenine-specific DNA-methyltransferase
VADQFDALTREQLLKLVRQRERQKKLGLVWERDAIERDTALDDRFVSLSLVVEALDRLAGALRRGWKIE